MKTKQLIILRESNDIQELLISYALFSILLDMDYGFPVTLKRKKGAYIIELEEEIETSEIEIIASESDTDYSRRHLSEMSSKFDFDSLVRIMFGSADDFGDYSGGVFNSGNDNLDKIFSYYSTLDTQFITGILKKKEHGSYTSGVYTVKGFRGKSPKGTHIPNYIRFLSILGFYRSTQAISLCVDGDAKKKVNEITWLAIPSEKGVTYLNRWTPFININKETGEIKVIKHLSTKYKKDKNNTEDKEVKKNISTIKAQLKVRMQLELSIEDSIEDFYGYYEFNAVPTGYSALNDKVNIITWIDTLSESLLIKLEALVGESTQNINIKESTARFLNAYNVENFSSFVGNITKSDQQLFKIKDVRELSAMVNKSNLLDIQAIKDYANMIRRFMVVFKGDGYTAQKELLSANTESKLFSALAKINVNYFRRFDTYKVKDSSLQELFSDILGSGNYSVQDVVNAILILSTVKSEDAPTDSLEDEEGNIISEPEDVDVTISTD